MEYCGIDLSLVGTGFIMIDDEAKITVKSLFSTSPKLEIEDRIISITNDVRNAVIRSAPEMIYIEGLAFGARGQAMLELAALHYHVRISLYQHACQYKIISPSEVKKFVTGKGNVKKELMLLKTYKKWGETFEDNNLCDAYCLARYALNKEGSHLKLTRRLKKE